MKQGTNSHGVIFTAGDVAVAVDYTEVFLRTATNAKRCRTCKSNIPRASVYGDQRSGRRHYCLDCLDPVQGPDAVRRLEALRAVVRAYRGETSGDYLKDLTDALDDACYASSLAPPFDVPSLASGGRDGKESGLVCGEVRESGSKPSRPFGDLQVVGA